MNGGAFLSLLAMGLAGSTQGGTGGGVVGAGNGGTGDGLLGVNSVTTSPWFALITGVASVASLLLTLYGTQVRAIPFSYYRTLAWRKTLLLSFGIGLVVFGTISFLNQPPPPWHTRLSLLYSLLTGYLPPADPVGFGSPLWVFLAAFGVTISVVGLLYDPIVKLREALIYERSALASYREAAISDVCGRETPSSPSLDPDKKRLCDDILEYYSEVQVRLLDTLLGQSLPRFRSSYEIPHSLPTPRVSERADPGPGSA